MAQSRIFWCSGALHLYTLVYLLRLAVRQGRAAAGGPGRVFAGCTDLFSLFSALTSAANPVLAKAVAAAPVVVLADKHECSFQFDPLGKATFSSSCDIARSYLARAGRDLRHCRGSAGRDCAAQGRKPDTEFLSGEHMEAKELAVRRAAWEKESRALISAAGYPSARIPAR